MPIPVELLNLLTRAAGGPGGGAGAGPGDGRPG
jgi:hypothetical protein